MQENSLDFYVNNNSKPEASPNKDTLITQTQETLAESPDVKKSQHKMKQSGLRLDFLSDVNEE